MVRCPICGFQGMPEPEQGRVTCCSCWFEWGLDETPTVVNATSPAAAPVAMPSPVGGAAQPRRGRVADDYDFILKRKQEIAEAEGRKPKSPAPPEPAPVPPADFPYAIDWPMG